jgi:hypothetical protein
MDRYITASSRRSLLGRVGAVAVAMSALAVLAGGCDQGNEGDRCNPLLSHDECGGDTLVCSGPGTSYPLPGNCVENYCCPKDPTKSSNPYCNGTDNSCPAPDAGSSTTTADAGDAGDAAPE